MQAPVSSWHSQWENWEPSFLPCTTHQWPVGEERASEGGPFSTARLLHAWAAVAPHRLAWVQLGCPAAHGCLAQRPTHAHGSPAGGRAPHRLQCSLCAEGLPRRAAAHHAPPGPQGLLQCHTVHFGRLHQRAPWCTKQLRGPWLMANKRCTLQELARRRSLRDGVIDCTHRKTTYYTTQA